VQEQVQGAVDQTHHSKKLQQIQVVETAWGLPGQGSPRPRTMQTRWPRRNGLGLSMDGVNWALLASSLGVAIICTRHDEQSALFCPEPRCTSWHTVDANGPSLTSEKPVAADVEERESVRSVQSMNIDEMHKIYRPRLTSCDHRFGPCAAM